MPKMLNDKTQLFTMTVHDLELRKLDLVGMYHMYEGPGFASLRSGLLRAIREIDDELRSRN